MRNNKNLDKQGFTLIELLMVILVIGVLAAIGITQFVNFGKDAKDAATKSNLQVLRRGIAAQNAMMRARCGYSGTSWPTLAAVQANDITTDGICTTTLIPNAEDRKFFPGTLPPPNPWNDSASTTAATVFTACPPDKTGGWCYDSGTGEVKANSENNGDSTAYEDTF